MVRREENPIECLIIGAGIAGASLAYFLSEHGWSDVLVIERESQPGYHATGRSAATLVELDPVPAVQQLKILGAGFLREAPGFAENPVLERCGVLMLLHEPQWSTRKDAAAAGLANEPRLELLMPREVNRRLGGVLQEGEFAGAAFLPDDGFIDIHELLTSYMRHSRRAGAGSMAIERRSGRNSIGVAPAFRAMSPTQAPAALTTRRAGKTPPVVATARCSPRSRTMPVTSTPKRNSTPARLE